MHKWIKIWPMAQVHLKLQYASGLMQLLAGFSSLQVVELRAPFLEECWMEAPSVLFVVSSPLCSLFYQIQQGRELPSKLEVMVSCSLNMEITSHHSSSLFIRSKSLDQPTLKGIGLYKCVNARKKRSLRAILESVPQKVNLFIRTW